MGGNDKLRHFFDQNGVSNQDTIVNKYHTEAAELYRERCVEKQSMNYFD